MEKWALPEGWQWLPLSAVARDTDRRNPTQTPDEVFTYVDIASIDSDRGAIDASSVKVIKGSDAPSRARKVIRRGDVILATTRPYLKNIALVPEDYDGQVCSTGFCVLSARQGISLPKFIFFATRSAFFIDQLAPKQRGANYPAVSDSDVFDTEIPIPYPNDPARSLAEQRRIVARLEALLGEVRELRQLQAEIEADVGRLMEAVLAEVFGTITRPSWDTKPLIAFCTFEGGAQPPKHEFITEPQDGYIRLLQIRDFASDEKAVYVPDTNRLRKCLADDVLIGRYGASVGKILTGKSGAYNVAIVKTIPDETQVSKSFLKWLLRSEHLQRRLVEIPQRAAQAGFNKDEVLRFPMPLPTRNFQDMVASQLDAVESELRAMQSLQSQDGQQLNELEQSILAQAFRGEL